MTKTPAHVAIIMDGNGRWAKARGLPRAMGHQRGAQRVREIVKEAKNIGIKVLTIFAFSTENWNRPEAEIKILFSYFVLFLKNYKRELVEEDIRLNVIGRRDRFTKTVLNTVLDVETATRNNRGLVFNVCVDYGGRWDIVEAAKKVALEYKSGKLSLDRIGEDVFSGFLAFSGMPDPDLLIRTSGEQRISNFLLWNLAYSELYFTEINWPDFNSASLREAVENYSGRNRRFGKT